MNYFKYKKETFADWDIFHQLNEMSPEQIERLYCKSDYSHTLEIVNSAMNGRINKREFDLKAYMYACSENDGINKLHKAKKESHIVDVDSSEEDLNVGFGDVSSRKIKSIEDAFEEVLVNKNFEENIRYLKGIRTEYFVEHGIDLVGVLKSALKGVPEAIEEFKKIISEVDNCIKDVIISLCEDSHGRLLTVLEGL